MTEKRKATEVLDACPFPPDSERPGRGLRTGLLNYYEELFGNWKIIASILTAASLVLAYSLLSVPPPLAPSLSVPDSWGREFPEYEPVTREEFVWVPEYENQTVQKGDIVLEGENVLLIENCTYVLDGLLLVKDNARLILRNAELYIKERRGWTRYDILPGLLYMGFNDSASFEAYNSSVISEDLLIDVGFFGNSRSSMSFSELNSVSIYADEDSFIQITDSILGRINAAGRARCEAVNSKIQIVDCYSILNRLLLPQKIWEECRVELWNSTLEYLSVDVMNCDMSLSTPLLGFHGFWNPYEYFGGEEVVAFNITLHDTNLTRSWGLNAISGSLSVEKSSDMTSVWVRNGTLLITDRSMSNALCEDGLLKVTNSTISFVECTGDSKAYIDGSNIWWFSIEGGVEADVSSSKAELLILQDFNGSIQFNRFLVEELELYGKLQAYVEGSIRLGENATSGELYWDNGFFVRSFEVRTQGGDRVLPDVRLTLYDKDDNTVWSGETDKNGEASFNITFCRLWPLYERFKYVNNYRDNWRLEATDGEFTKNASVSLFADTPIMFVFPSVSEPPLWEQRWLLSAASATTISVVLIGLLYREIKKTNP